MKKVLTFVFALMMCVSLCACGNGNDVPKETETAKMSKEDAKMSKEEMIAVAEECGAVDIQNDSVENIARAKQKYCNKTLLLSGNVRRIQEEYIELSSSYGVNYMVDVYLPLEELALLEQGQNITVVGTTTDEIIAESKNVAQYTFDYSHYQMPEAYLVKDTIEATGTLCGDSYAYASAFFIKIGKSSEYSLIYFAESVDTSALKDGQEITFVARAINRSDVVNVGWSYYDAVIIG